MHILKSPAAKMRTKRVKAMLKLNGLSRRHLYLARRGTAWQPYHNYQHCYEVALCAAEGARWEKLSRQDTRQVILAGLYSDHRHTADYRVDDAENIRRAIRGVKWKLLLHRRGLKGYDRRTIPYLIDASKSGRRPKNITGRILRDAELLANLHEEATIWFDALSKEEGREYTIGSALAYLTDDKVLTDWGRWRLTAFRRRHDFHVQLDVDITEVKPKPSARWVYQTNSAVSAANTRHNG